MRHEMELVNKAQKEIALLNQISSLLGWDHQTFMPEEGVSSRAEQSALVNGLIHDRVTSGKLYAALRDIRNQKKKLSGDTGYAVNRLWKICSKARKLPSEFIEELSRTTSLAHSAWEKAKAENNFKSFQPHLGRIVALKRQEAHYIGLAGHPYNSLLDAYEEGMTVEKLRPAFDGLRENLVELIRRIKASKRFREYSSIISKTDFPPEKQIGLCRDVIARIGMHWNSSRLDFAEHPFTTTIGTRDVRITTNVRKNPLFAFESTIHEAGHALYELGYPQKYAYTVLFESPSMGMHESQSRIWENMVGKSLPFWRFYGPRFNRAFGTRLAASEWYSEINRISAGLIRVESDELHYCLHIILRFELETALIEGSVTVGDLPLLWKQKMKSLVGVSPGRDADGVLQDEHWSGGAFGYFPSYALGTIYAAQLYEAAKRGIPGLEQNIGRGYFGSLKTWLTKNVHAHGAKFQAEEVIKRVCGEGLNPAVYIDYLNEKYKRLYKC